MEEEKTLEEKIKMYKTDVLKIRFDRFETEYTMALDHEKETVAMKTALEKDLVVKTKAIAVAKLYLELKTTRDQDIGYAIQKTLRKIKEAGVDKAHKVYKDIRKFTEDKVEELKGKVSFESYDLLMRYVASAYVKG